MEFIALNTNLLKKRIARKIMFIEYGVLYKICSRCKAELPFTKDNFYRNNTIPHCKWCERKRKKESRKIL